MIEIADSYNCLRLDNGVVFQVDYYKEGDDIFFDIGGNRIPFGKVKVEHVAKLISREGKFKDSDVLNLWRVDVDKSKLDSEDDIRNHGGVSMEYEHYFERYFEIDRKLTDNIHIIAVIATNTTKLERKRPSTEEESPEPKRRKWDTNGAILDFQRDNVYFVDPLPLSDSLLNMIRGGDFVTIHGARASGKSTRVLVVKEQLEKEGYICIYMTLELIEMSSVKEFWSSIGISLARAARKHIKHNVEFAVLLRAERIKSSNEFTDLFGSDNWKKKVVLFVDDSDILESADDAIKSSFLKAVRGIKATRNEHAIWSINIVGTFNILHLSSKDVTTPPFNVNKPFHNPNFTREQVRILFKEFADHEQIEIEPLVIDEIHFRANGHAGLVCLCGKAIQLHLMKKIGKDFKLTYSIWLKFNNSLQEEILGYPTFRKLVNTLTTLDKAKPAVDLFRLAFVGFLDSVRIVDSQEIRLAEFLTAEGVLTAESNNTFKMSSAFIDELMKREVIPELYKSF